MSDAFAEAVHAAHWFRDQMGLLRKVVCLSVENTGGEQWEKTSSESEPEPTPDSIRPMEEPSSEWEKNRLEEIREQMRLRWPTAPRPLRRRPLPTR